MTEINLNQRYILQNLLNGVAKKSDDSSKLIKKTTIKESDEKLISKGLEKYLKDFALGYITYKNFEVFMEGLGAEDYSQTIVNGNIVQKFTVNGKKYEITSNIEAADSGTDKIVDKKGSYLKYNEWSETNEFANMYNVNGKRTDKIYYNDKGQISSEVKFNTEGEKVGNITYLYDDNGKVKTETIYNYDKSSGKNVLQTQYIYNTDGTVTMYTFGKDGKTKFLAGTYKQGEFANLQPSDLSKTNVVDRYDSNNNKIGTYEYEYDANGNKTLTRTYDIDGNLTKTYYYMKDENGKNIGAIYYNAPNSSGNYNVNTKKNGLLESSVTLNSSNKVLTEKNYTYNADGNKIGYKQTTYDPSTGKAKTTTIYNYDKENNKNIPQSLYVYNADNTVTMYTFSKDGKTKYVTCTYDSGKFLVDNVVDPSKTKTGDIKDSSGKKTGSYIDKYDSNGRKLLREYYDPNNQLTKTDHYMYDENGKFVHTQYITYKADGSYNTNIYKDNRTTETITFDKNNKKTKKITYSYDANGNKIGSTQINYDTATGKEGAALIYEYDKASNKSILQSKYVYNADNTVTYYTCNNNKTYFACTYDSGKFLVDNVVDSSKTKTGDIKDSSGNKKGSYIDKYDSNGKKLLREYYDINNQLTKIDHYMYDENGKLAQTQYTTYNADGSYNANIYKDNKTIESVTLDKNNKKTKRIIYTYDKNNNKTGYTVFTFNSNGTVVRRDYDANGNTTSGKNAISGSTITVSGITLTTQKIYDALTSNINNTLFNYIFSWSTKDALQLMGGKYTASFLEASQATSNKKPLGSDSNVYHYSDEGEFKDYIYNKIQKDCGYNVYGYEPEQIKGYHWSKSSSLCKTIAADSDMQAYVKKNIKNLISGNISNLPSMSFNKNKDLYYSIHGSVVMSSKVSGTMLKLKLVDVYDFDQKNISKVTKSGGGMGNKFDGIGAAAMKDGKLVPYYEVFEVNIDLKTIYNSNELKNLGLT